MNQGAVAVSDYESFKVRNSIFTNNTSRLDSYAADILVKNSINEAYIVTNIFSNSSAGKLIIANEARIRFQYN